MHQAYARGDNAMAYARNHLAETDGEVGSNLLAATLIAYDLQTGSYTALARANPEALDKLCAQLSSWIRTVLPQGGTILEVGVGEATTLAGVVKLLGKDLVSAYGFDLSWSRVDEGRRWLTDFGQNANLFVGDLFNIPLVDNSMDVVYSSHSLEPNGGREEEAIAECLRVARHAVVLIEPAYELANAEARTRMDSHGYVRGLREAAERLGATVLEHSLLEHTSNELNPSGVLILAKQQTTASCVDNLNIWQCPLTDSRLSLNEDVFFAEEVGIAYPILRGIPLLRAEHAVVASKCK
ncbi:methyltransferase domain-containing protein [Methylophilaceae bacterium]|nr:methyltransferase domain-containing protein [Methylophilaceae bacterium]